MLYKVAAAKAVIDDKGNLTVKILEDELEAESPEELEFHIEEQRGYVLLEAVKA